MAFSSTHAMLAVAIGSAIAPRGSLGRVLFAGAACAVVPDLDLLLAVAGTGAREWHRTLTHSMFFAAAVGLVFSALAFGRRDPSPIRIPVYLALSMASHGVLDAMTTYPIGVAFYSPLSWKRYVAPWQPISGVAIEWSLAIGLAFASVAFLRLRGIRVISEGYRPAKLLDEDRKPIDQVKG